jgi:hypothetical protein
VVGRHDQPVVDPVGDERRPQLTARVVGRQGSEEGDGSIEPGDRARGVERPAAEGRPHGPVGRHEPIDERLAGDDDLGHRMGYTAVDAHRTR